jgi:hypothetical protein
MPRARRREAFPVTEDAVLVEVLTYHWRDRSGGCACGWAELGRSWPEHVAIVYAESCTKRNRERDATQARVDAAGTVINDAWPGSDLRTKAVLHAIARALTGARPTEPRPCGVCFRSGWFGSRQRGSDHHHCGCGYPCKACAPERSR